MAVGFPAKTNFATGDVLTATNVNDITGTLNLLESAQYAAGKNKIINGDFGVWQRGTTFTNSATNTYTADRWSVNSTNSTIDVTRSTFTPGTAPVAGYEGTYFATIAAEATDTDPRFQQRIEDVRTFAGQTMTFSFWAKSTITTDAIRFIRITQNFGSGGSADVTTTTPAAFTLTSSWARYSVTVAVPSITGKTIGTNSNNLRIAIDLKQSTAQTLDIWGVQAENGSTASPFQTASGSIAGELALCQRFFQVVGGTATTAPMVLTYSGYASTYMSSPFNLATEMRTTPSATKSGTWFVSNCAQPTAEYINAKGYVLTTLVTSIGNFQYYPNSTDDIITFSAEY